MSTIAISTHRLLGRVTCAALLAAAGCSSSAGSTPAPVSVAEPVNAQAIECNSYASAEQRELYVPWAMNNKLAHYTDFAASVGVRSVDDCASARLFAQRYGEYLAAHPGFDDAEPREPTPALGALPSTARAEADLPKVLNGVPVGLPFPNGPIVRLTSEPAPGQLGEDGKPLVPLICTGTFIAKNWIVTAAHCLPLGPDHKTWFGWNNWKVEWPGADSQVLASATIHVPALRYPDPGYLGSLGPVQGRRDFALLYLPSLATVERLLPPDASAGSAMLLSGRAVSFNPPAPAEGDTILYAGWGQGSGKTNLLTFGTINNANAISTTLDFIESVLTADQSRTCQGDSGGPATRGATLADTGAPALQGTLVGSPLLDATNCTLPSSDPNNLNFQLWAAVDPEIDFIQETLKKWNGPNFECTAPPADTDNVLQCWTTPCSSDDDCDADEYCSVPGSVLPDPCTVCADGTCNCIKGQCLKGPTLDGGTEGGP